MVSGVHLSHGLRSGGTGPSQRQPLLLLGAPDPCERTDHRTRSGRPDAPTEAQTRQEGGRGPCRQDSRCTEGHSRGGAGRQPRALRPESGAPD